MLYTKEQVMNGLMAYIDNEVINKLPTSGKIIVGASVALAIKNSQSELNNALGTYGKQLGVVNGNEQIDIDKLADAVRDSMNRYGEFQIDLPFVGSLTFKGEDVDALRRYIT